MPNKCSAPGCRSNYDSEPHTPIFKMPNGPPHIVSKWKQFLHTECIEEIKKMTSSQNISVMKMDIDNLLEEISSIDIENHRQELSTPTVNQQIVQVIKQSRRTVDKLSNSQAILDDCQEDNQLLSSLQFILCQLDNLFRPNTHRTYNIAPLISTKENKM
ncbi:hypothetical protein LOD99_10910 [Oopsacas minuta]|uniref:THAP-type domain-containing protein n=1 Tax=Oopsacas minuta TaxID=111878 RepID=A0AAV7KE44_9METZ|nr:hypothetical protein LOD99_10910 [Oopsacas minuta]